MKKQKVSYHVSSVYQIPDEFFKKHQIKYLIVDLDNTLDSAYTSYPRKEAFLLKERLEKMNIQLIVISNNALQRVKPYCEALGVKYLSSAQKFRKGRIKKFLDDNDIKVEDSLFVGDQIFTDRIYVNKIKGRLILTEPLVKKDQFFTRFIRRFDTKKRNKWKNKNLLGNEIEKEKFSC